MEGHNGDSTLEIIDAVNLLNICHITYTYIFVINAKEESLFITWFM